MNNQTLDLDQLLKIAIEASSKAYLLLKNGNSKSNILSDIARDLKSLADLDSQELIIKYLKDNSSYRIISEELENSPIKTDELCWIIDPLDGTVNFMKGIPFYAVSVALWRGTEPLLGVIYDVPGNNIYTAIADRGAWLNGNKIAISKTTLQSQSVLATGFPTFLDHNSENLINFVKDVQSFKKIRMFGSAAMSLAFVADGKVESYKEKDIRLWDIAAGIALVKGAGGKTSLTLKENFFCDVNVSNVDYK